MPRTPEQLNNLARFAGGDSRLVPSVPPRGIWCFPNINIPLDDWHPDLLGHAEQMMLVLEALGKRFDIDAGWFRNAPETPKGKWWVVSLYEYPETAAEKSVDGRRIVPAFSQGRRTLADAVCTAAKAVMEAEKKGGSND